MALKFYIDEGRLIACDDDACAIWTGHGWNRGSVELAREVWITKEEIPALEASKRFPDADMKGLPDFEAMKEEIAAGYEPVDPAILEKYGIHNAAMPEKNSDSA